MKSKTHGMAYFLRTPAKSYEHFTCGILPQDDREQFNIIFIDRDHPSFSISFII